MVTLFLVFWGTSIVFSIVAAPMYIVIHSVGGFPQKEIWECENNIRVGRHIEWLLFLGLLYHHASHAPARVLSLSYTHSHSHTHTHTHTHTHAHPEQIFNVSCHRFPWVQFQLHPIPVPINTPRAGGLFQSILLHWDKNRAADPVTCIGMFNFTFLCVWWRNSFLGSLTNLAFLFGHSFDMWNFLGQG